MKWHAGLTLVALSSVVACAPVPVPLASTVGEPRVTRSPETAARDRHSGARPNVSSKRAAPRTAARAVPESPKTTRTTIFARRLDRKKLEARGAVRTDAELDSSTLTAATTFNNATWAGNQRQELLAYLRAAPVDPTATFDDGDARIIAKIQRGSGAQAHGKLSDETMAVLFAAGLRFSARKEQPWRVQIDFYPAELENAGAWDEAMVGHDFRTVEAPAGEGMLYVHAGGRLVATYRARGGPPSTLTDIHDHLAVPTEPGSFKLGAPHIHVTDNWENSQIPWGAEIREQGNGYQFRWPSTGAWRWATARDGPTLKTPLENDVFEDLPRVTREGQTMLIWTKNDFGPTAWQLAPSTNYVHTTPPAEAAAARGATTILTLSHGCIHIDPRERDEMVERGYLQPGVSFVVHEWSEHVLPDMARSDMHAGQAPRLLSE